MAIPERILHDYNPALIANTALYSPAGNAVGSGDAAVLDLSGSQLSVNSGAMTIAGGHGYLADVALLSPALTTYTNTRGQPAWVFSSRQRVRCKPQNHFYLLTNCATVGGGGAGLLILNGTISLDCRDLGGQMAGSVTWPASNLDSNTEYDFEIISDLSADGTTRTITINIYGIDGTTLFNTSATTNYINLLGNYDLRIASFQGFAITIIRWQTWDRTLIVESFPAAATQTAITATAKITGGNGTNTIQWNRSTLPGVETPLAGQTSATLNDTAVASGTIYYYTVTVTDSDGRTLTTEEFAARPASRRSLKIGFIGNSVPPATFTANGASVTGATSLSDLMGKMLRFILGDGAVEIIDHSQGGSAMVDWDPANPASFWAFYVGDLITQGCDIICYQFGGNDTEDGSTGSIIRTARTSPALFGQILDRMIAAVNDAGIISFVFKPTFNGTDAHADISLLPLYAAQIDLRANGKTVLTDRGEPYQLLGNNPELLDVVRRHPTDTGKIYVAAAWAAEIAANLPPVIPDVVAAAGPLSVAIDSLVSLIAAVPFFQTWTNTANASLAEQRIFVGEVGYPIYSAAIAAGVLAIQTREFHEIQVGDVVTIEGAGLGAEANVDLDGQWTVTAITPDTFTAATALPDMAVIYPQFSFAMDCVRPIAVVAEGADGLESENVGSGNAAVYSGSLDILLESDTSSQYVNSPANALTEARNAVGNFLEGLMETQDTGDLMVLNNAKITSGPEFVSKTQQDDGSHRFERWRAIIRVTWGVKS